MLEQGKVDNLHQAMVDILGHGMEPTRVDDTQWEFPVPYGDQHGDPLWFSIACEGNRVMIDDGGAVAGLLFSLGQDEEGGPALELLSSLAQRYELVADYDLGLVRGVCSLEEVSNTLPAFTRVVLTLLTASPFLGTKPQRRRLMGPRLRSRVQAKYKDLGIASYVERRVQIPGRAVAHWPTDFRWQLDLGERFMNVFVLAADLDILDPIGKANSVSGLALDTMAARERDELRIVIDTQKAGSDARQAADLIRQQETILKYDVYDFADSSQRNSFLTLAEQEVWSEPAREWRMTFDRIEPPSGRQVPQITSSIIELADGSNGHSQLH